VACVVLGVLAALLPSVAGASSAFVGPFHTITTVASTVPGNGDVNPYGVAVVPETVGRLVRGDVLVSNFNDGANLQGTGSTIVEITPNGVRRRFARIQASTLSGPCPGGIGLTTALAVLSHGFVVVGSLPTTDGMAATARAGCLLVLDRDGQVVETWSGSPINGPWDMTAVSTARGAVLFVTNVLNGTVAAGGKVVNRGTVVRIAVDVPAHGLPRRISTVVIASGFAEHTDPAALVVGPTGVGLAADDTLFVADTAQNRLAAIPDALDRRSDALAGADVSAGGALNGPLGLAIARNGNILSVNAGNGMLVETTPAGAQVATRTLDTSGAPPGAGTLFGLAVAPAGKGVYFVDDGSNTLNLLH